MINNFFSRNSPDQIRSFYIKMIVLGYKISEEDGCEEQKE